MYNQLSEEVRRLLLVIEDDQQCDEETALESLITHIKQLILEARSEDGLPREFRREHLVSP